MRMLPGRREWGPRPRGERSRAFLGLFIGFQVICTIAVVAMFVTYRPVPHTAPTMSGGSYVLRELPSIISSVFMMSAIASVIATLPMLAVMQIERRVRIDLDMMLWAVIGSGCALLPCLILAALAGSAFVVAVSAFACGGFAGVAAYAGRSTATTGMSGSDTRLVVSCWGVLFAASSLLVWLLDVPAYLRSALVT